MDITQLEQIARIVISIIIIYLLLSLYLKYKLITAVLKIHNIENQLKSTEIDIRYINEYSQELLTLQTEQNELLKKLINKLES